MIHWYRQEVQTLQVAGRPQRQVTSIREGKGKEKQREVAQGEHKRAQEGLVALIDDRRSRVARPLHEAGSSRFAKLLFAMHLQVLRHSDNDVVR